MSNERTYLEHDWYAGGIPRNVEIGRDVYVDTSYGFASFASHREPGLVLGAASGAYDRATFVVGAQGQITVGEYTVLNGTYLICHNRLTIGSHCLLAWGSVITDSWLDATHTLDNGDSLDARRACLRAAGRDVNRQITYPCAARPVTLEDNVWIGFDSVVLPGVTVGRGAVIGCKTVISEDVPPYAIVVGSPPRIVRYLKADDTDAARRHALHKYAR